MSQAFKSLSFEEFHSLELQSRMDAHSTRLPPAYAARLRPLAIVIQETGESRTYAMSNGCVSVAPGDAQAETIVEIAHESWEEMVHDLETVPSLIYGQRVKRIRGDVMHFLEWEPALRWMFTGRAVYDPETIDLEFRAAEQFG